MKLNLPTALTLLRIALIPALIVAMSLPFAGARTVAAAIFAVAALSDWLDGFLARRLEMTSGFGAFLDPVADKLIVSTALILLLQQNPDILLTLSTVVIIGREITISALREWMAEMGERGVVAVSALAKVKAVAQMIAITLLLYAAPIPLITPLTGASAYTVGLFTLYIAVILTLWSMLQYLLAAWPVLKR